VTHKLGGPNHISRFGLSASSDHKEPHQQYTMLKEQLLDYAQV